MCNIIDFKNHLVCHFILCFLVVISSTSSDVGLIIAGGQEWNTWRSVEVFFPATGRHCSLPDLPNNRRDHTLTNNILCGGLCGDQICYDQNDDPSGNSYHNCLTFSNGQWIKSHELLDDTHSQASWMSEEGLVLLGGYYNPTISQILPTEGGHSAPYFDMTHTMDACSIPDIRTNTVILAGGFWTMSSVTRYGKEGFIEDLPNLNTGRQEHGCGGFYRDDGSMILVVAGGEDDDRNDLSSTEILVEDSDAWTVTTSLPFAVWGLKGVTLDNIVYMAGGHGRGDIRDEIWEWNDEEREWVKKTSMMIPRSHHAISTLYMGEEFMQYCV